VYFVVTSANAIDSFVSEANILLVMAPEICSISSLSSTTYIWFGSVFIQLRARLCIRVVNEKPGLPMNHSYTWNLTEGPVAVTAWRVISCPHVPASSYPD